MAKLNGMLQQNKIAVAVWGGNLLPEMTPAATKSAAATGQEEQKQK